MGTVVEPIYSHYDGIVGVELAEDEPIECVEVLWPAGPDRDGLVSLHRIEELMGAEMSVGKTQGPDAPSCVEIEVGPADYAISLEEDGTAKGQSSLANPSLAICAVLHEGRSGADQDLHRPKRKILD